MKFILRNIIDAIGFSYGGDVLYQLALINPLLIDSMVTIGSVGTWSIKDHPKIEKSFTYETAKDYPWVKDGHESDAQVRTMFEQFKHNSIRMSDDDLQKIKTNVLIVAGANDQGVPLEEIKRSRTYLPNSELWIIPNIGHGGENKETFVYISKKFLLRK